MVTGEKSSDALDHETLVILGDEGTNTLNTSNNIHAGLVPIWSAILKDGLKEDTRDLLVSRYPPAANCTLMAPPKVNIEVRAAVSDATSQRDIRFSTIQAMLGASLSALGQAITENISNPVISPTKTRLLTLMGDAARLIAGVH